VGEYIAAAGQNNAGCSHRFAGYGGKNRVRRRGRRVGNGVECFVNLELWYRLNAVGFALIWAVTGETVFWGCRPQYQTWRRLPRERHAGALLALAVLAGCAWFAQPMLEGDLATWRPLLWLAVPGFAVLGFFFLDFLFARTWSGLVALAAIDLLHLGFVVSAPWRPVFSAVLYLCALAALAGVTVPWRLRDLLEQCSNHRAWRVAATATAGFLTLFFLAYAVLG
jgi:hypothetical protein